MSIEALEKANEENAAKTVKLDKIKLILQNTYFTEKLRISQAVLVLEEE